jgi:hypothetical protein
MTYSRSGPFIAGDTATSLTRGSVGHETDLNAVKKRKIVARHSAESFNTLSSFYLLLSPFPSPLSFADLIASQ